jgi:hypothetical protein
MTSYQDQGGKFCGFGEGILTKIYELAPIKL